MAKIFWKLFLTYTLILIVSFLILLPIIGISFKNYYQKKISEELISDGLLLRRFLLEDLSNKNKSALSEKVNLASKDIKARITVISENGIVLSDSFEDPFSMDNHINRPEIIAAKNKGIGNNIRFSSTLKTHMMYAAVSVNDGTTLLGFIRLALPLTETNKQVGYIYKIISIGTLLSLFLALCLSILITKTFVNPIKEMQRVTSIVMKGDLSRRADIKSRDELGSLAKNMNRMIEELERKMTEINKDRNELEAILSSMVEGVIVIGKDGYIVLMNAPVYRMLDLRTKDTVGRHYWEVIRNETINNLIKHSLVERKIERKEVHIISNEESYFDVHLSPVMVASGDMLGIVIVFFNITELKRLERIRSEFTANVSHELKTPLTSIKGFVETLKEGAINDKAKAKEFLDIIEKNTEKLETLINDLLVLAKIESKEIKMSSGEVDIKQLIKGVISNLSGRIKERQHRIELNIPEKAHIVKGDSSKLEQVFLNLLDNAVKFTNPGGKISIDVRDEGEYTVVDVKDTGPGISPEHLQRIFERFYRVDKGGSRDLSGTGLGLSIVKHIVEAHGGRVNVKSSIGEGSIFSVLLPK